MDNIDNAYRVYEIFLIGHSMYIECPVFDKVYIINIIFSDCLRITIGRLLSMIYDFMQYYWQASQYDL